MCMQVYRYYQVCGCQIAQALWPCVLGPTHPECTHIQTGVVVKPDCRCPYHERILASRKRRRPDTHSRRTNPRQRLFQVDWNMYRQALVPRHPRDGDEDENDDGGESSWNDGSPGPNGEERKRSDDWTDGHVRGKNRGMGRTAVRLIRPMTTRGVKRGFYDTFYQADIESGVNDEDDNVGFLTPTAETEEEAQKPKRRFFAEDENSESGLRPGYNEPYRAYWAESPPRLYSYGEGYGETQMQEEYDRGYESGLEATGRVAAKIGARRKAKLMRKLKAQMRPYPYRFSRINV